MYNLALFNVHCQQSAQFFNHFLHFVQLYRVIFVHITYFALIFLYLFTFFLHFYFICFSLFELYSHLTRHFSSSTSTKIMSQPTCFISHQRITYSFSLPRQKKNFPGTGTITASTLPQQTSISTSATQPSLLQFLTLITSQFFNSHKRIRISPFTSIKNQETVYFFIFYTFLFFLCKIIFHKAKSILF